MLKRLGFAALTVVLVLGLCELSLRILGDPPQPRPINSPFVGGGSLLDPDYGWRLAPGSVVSDPVRRAWEDQHGPRPPGQLQSTAVDVINPDGFRDTPLWSPRPLAQRRVLVLGDSSVYGSGVPVELRFTELIESALNPEGDQSAATKEIEIISGGVPGWTSAQSLQQLRDSLHLGLDAVVVYSMNSDLMQTEGAVSDAVYFSRRRRLRGGLAMTRWLAALLAPLSASSTRASVGNRTQGRRVPVGAYRQFLRQLGDVCHQQELGLVFVIPAQAADLLHAQPMISGVPKDDAEAIAMTAELNAAIASDGQRWGKQQYRMAMALVARELGAPVIDAPTAFNIESHRHPLSYLGGDALFVDSIHPSITGHALLTRLIQPVLEQVLTTVPPWSQRRDRVPEAPPPAWLQSPGESSVTPPPETRVRLSDQTTGTAADRHVMCTPQDDERTHTQLPVDQLRLLVEIPAVAPEQPVHVALLQAGPQKVKVVARSLCSGPAFRLVLPRDLGSAHLVAWIDQDQDGPCFADRATLKIPPILLSGQPAPLTLTLTLTLAQTPTPRPFAPPFGLPLGVYPLLSQLLSALVTPVTGGFGLVVDPATLGDLDPLQIVAGTTAALDEAGGAITLDDVLDRPTTPLSAYDGLVVINSLGSDLVDRVSDAMMADSYVQAGWTDPAGRSWTLIRSGPHATADFAARTAGAPKLDPGTGRHRALERSGPDLPAELMRR